MELIDMINYDGEVYTYNVWNYFLNFRKRDSPKLVVDITETFKTKVEAFRKHKSQGLARLSLMWSVYFKALLRGLENNVKYAEVFYRVK